MKPAGITEIYIENVLKDSAVVKNILQRADSHTKIEFRQSITDLLRPEEAVAGYTSKQSLIVRHFPGEFLSLCPGSDGMVCCNYFVLNTGPGCIYDCHYCFLQSFMNTPVVTLHANLDDLFHEMDRKLAGKKGPFRIGTGEYTDSLAIESLTGYSALLVERFARLKNAYLELKTKSSDIDPILNLDHGGRTVISWSLNPEEIIDSVEEGCSSLEERFHGAGQAIAAGYRVAFHLDPIIYSETWETRYVQLIEDLFQRIGPGKIAWISLGGFRYSPELKEILQLRFPGDRLTAAEMIQGADGKYRYFKTIRERIYTTILSAIRERDPGLFVYFCMETRSMWERVFGQYPQSPSILEGGFRGRL